jgi:multimeric flavodoxin WrbA
MKISMINGSQKRGESNSGIILERLNNIIKGKHEVKFYASGLKQFTNEILEEIISGDVIVLAFPLFVYSLPSETIRMLIELENIIKRKQDKKLIIYILINCGFYEGKQNSTAFEIIKNWCERSGVIFGGGIGQGAGEMLGHFKNTPINKTPFANLGQALEAMAANIEIKKPFELTYLNPYFPRFLWKILAVRNWHILANKNGLKKKDLIRKL